MHPHLACRHHASSCLRGASAGRRAGQETTDLSERRRPAFKLPVGPACALPRVRPGAVPMPLNRRYTPRMP